MKLIISSFCDNCPGVFCFPPEPIGETGGGYKDIGVGQDIGIGKLIKMRQGL